MLESAWKITPHLEVATAYLSAGGATAQEKLKRAERLEQIQPNTFEALYASASAALDARDFDRARYKAEAAAKVSERESIYLLMADIEEADGEDQGRLRHWLAQALRAPRDPEWVADGQVSQHWLPVSPITGKLDAFEWKQAYGAAQGLVTDGTANGAEQAFRSLPAPIQASEPIAVPDLPEVAQPVENPVAQVDVPSELDPKSEPIVLDEAAPKKLEAANADHRSSVARRMIPA